MNLKQFLLAAIAKDEQLAASASKEGWWNAPLPPRLHKCTPHTKGFVNDLTYVERCACGGIRMDATGPWMERNSRRKSA